MQPSNLRQIFKKLLLPLKPERPLHALDHRIAKEWIKKRLAALYPELRGDPAALEKVYRELGLEEKGIVRRADGEVKSFEMSLSESLDDGFRQS